MNVDAAIVEVFKSKLFNDMCRRYGGNNHEDLKSEIMLIVCEMPEEKKIKIVENDYLLPFSLQIMRNQASSKKWTQYRKKYGNRENVKSLDELTQFDYVRENDGGNPIGELLSDEWYGADKMLEELEQEFNIGDLIIDKVKGDAQRQDNEFFYHSRLLMESIKYKNVKKTAQAIGIPYNSVRDNLKSYKQVLLQWAKG